MIIQSVFEKPAGCDAKVLQAVQVYRQRRRRANLPDWVTPKRLSRGDRKAIALLAFDGAVERWHEVPEYLVEFADRVCVPEGVIDNE